MKITTATHNNKKRCFTVAFNNEQYDLPFSRAGIPSPQKVLSTIIDEEVGREGFTYSLENGEENTIHIDAVLEYNKDPEYLAELHLYKLTLEAQRRMKSTDLSKREIIRKMGTSAAQLYRLLDQSNYKKHVDQMIKLLSVLDCEVSFVFNDKRKIA